MSLSVDDAVEGINISYSLSPTKIDNEAICEVDGETLKLGAEGCILSCIAISCVAWQQRRRWRDLQAGPHP